MHFPTSLYKAGYFFSTISTYNSLNTIFCSKGIKELVISIISLSLKSNIIVNTTPEFNSNFLV